MFSYIIQDAQIKTQIKYNKTQEIKKIIISNAIKWKIIFSLVYLPHGAKQQ